MKNIIDVFKDQAQREWLAWRQLCKHLEKLGIDPNSAVAAPLLAAVKLWSAERAELLREEKQPPELHDARRTYEDFVLDGWAP